MIFGLLQGKKQTKITVKNGVVDSTRCVKFNALMQPLVKMCSKGLLACSYKDIEDESKKSARERVRAVQWDSGIA